MKPSLLALKSTAIAFVCALSLSAVPATSETVVPFQEIEWRNLQPDLPALPAQNQDPNKATLQSLSEQWLNQADPFGTDTPALNDGIPESEEAALAELSQIPQQVSAPVVEELNGKRVRLAGYMVPLDFEATKLKKFLLVPYVGACIHVPAPPTNQVVFIETDDAVEFTGLYDPVYVTGTMTTTSSKTELAEAGYRIKADGIRPYQ